MNHPIEDLMSTTLDRIREMVDANTIIGSPIKPTDDITLIPISKVTVGVGSGGSDLKKKTGNNPLFGGGSGAGVSISPIAFLVISNGSVRLISVETPANSTVDRIIDMAPEVMDRIKGFVEKKD